MSGVPSGVRTSLALCSTLLLSAPAWATVGPGSGAGSRSVSSDSRPAPASRRAKSSQAEAPARAKSKDHRRGSAPKAPSARLPEGVTPARPDAEERARIAGGLTREQQSSKAADPQLLALRDAERVLFPRSLGGFRPGFEFEHLDPNAQARGLPPLAEAVPSATLSEAADLEWLRSLKLPDFPVHLTDQVVKYLKFYRDSKRGQAIARVWAAKSGRYTSAMQAELARNGLPRDLVWLSLIESGHNPTIVSPAGAAGMWQFIPESGRAYGLTVDRWVDERLDPQRATTAAALYLNDLHQRFGSWDLAMAGYNMGHGGLSRSIRKYNTNDFWRLVTYEAGIPFETALYVPKIAAVAIMMNNRHAFGIDQIKPDPAISFDTVFVDPAVALSDVSEAAGIPLESLRSMNPQYLLGRSPPAASSGNKKEAATRWPVRVPRGLGRRSTQLLAKAKHGSKFGSYIVRHGDTLETAAYRRKTSVKTLAALNGMSERERLTPGMVLLAPRLSKGERLRADQEDVVVIPPLHPLVEDRQRVFYRVLDADTLEGVAHAFHVSKEELAAWNDLRPQAKLQSGMSLQVFVPHNQDLSRVRHILPEHTRVLEAGSEAMVSHFEALNGRKRLVVLAKAGDTLSKIGRRYGLSSGMMERINQFSRHKKLEQGTRVVVYAKAGRSDKDERRSALGPLNAPVPSALP